MWRYTKEVLTNPDELVGAFSEYAQRLQSRGNPSRDKLEVAQKKVAKTERKLSNLIDLYQDDLCTKQQYIQRKKRLDIQLERDSEKISVLTRELNQAEKLARWVVGQRRAYRTNRMKPERLARLNILGFVWNASRSRKKGKKGTEVRGTI